MYPKYKNSLPLHLLHVSSQPSHEYADSICRGFAICRIVTILYKELLEKLLKGKTKLWSVPSLSALILGIYNRGFWGRETWSYLALLRTIIGVCCYSNSVIRLSLLEVILVQSDKERILEWIRIHETTPCPRSVSPCIRGEPWKIFFLRVQFTLCIKTRRGQEHEGQSCLSRLLLSWAAHRKKTHSVYGAWINYCIEKNKPNQPCTVS